MATRYHENPERCKESYLMGSCHALAYVISEETSMKVGVLKGRHFNGAPISDPFHLFVWADHDHQMIIDVKGLRPYEAMVKDFAGIAMLTAYSVDDRVEMTSTTLEHADEIYDDLGFDPGHVVGAAMDLADGLWVEIFREEVSEFRRSEMIRSYSTKFQDNEASHGFGFIF